MIKQLHFKWMLLLCALMVGTNVAWADAVPYVTADFTAKTAKNSTYTNTWTYGDWSLTNCANNNGGWAYIRCGGKGGDNATSTKTSSTVIQGTSSIDKAIKEVKLLHNGTSNANITIISFKLEVASDAEFETITNTIVDDETEISKSTPGTITFDEGAPYAADSYYRITINWTVKGTSNYGLDVTKIEFYESSGKTDAGLAFTPSSITVNIGEEETISFTKTTDATASFVVADETIAQYNSSTGKVTGLKEGTTTITATTDETSTYDAGLAVCTITVVDPNWLDYTTKEYANAEDVTSETYANGTIELAKGDGSNAPKWYDSGSAVRLYTGNTITITAKTGYVLTSVEFSVTSGSMDAADFDKKVSKVGSTNEFKLATPANEIVYTTTSNFRIKKVKLNIAEPATITLNAACTDGEGNYYGTYSKGKAFVVPADLTVTEIDASTGKLSLANYETGEIVPANTGVMVSSTTAGEHTVALATGGTSKLDASNSLYATGDAGVTASNMTAAAGDDKYFYRLTMHKGSILGFWWGAAEGAAFALAANKAYLAVPKSVMASGFTFGDEEVVTGISTIEHSTLNIEHSEVYNLNGQRVSQPTKGLYIVNGKKVIVK